MPSSRASILFSLGPLRRPLRVERCGAQPSGSARLRPKCVVEQSCPSWGDDPLSLWWLLCLLHKAQRCPTHALLSSARAPLGAAGYQGRVDEAQLHFGKWRTCLPLALHSRWAGRGRPLPFLSSLSTRAAHTQRCSTQHMHKQGSGLQEARQNRPARLSASATASRGIRAGKLPALQAMLSPAP